MKTNVYNTYRQQLHIIQKNPKNVNRTDLQGAAIQHSLGLLVRSSHDVPNGFESSSLNFDVRVTQEWHQQVDYFGVDYHLELFIATACQVRDGPRRVPQNLNNN